MWGTDPGSAREEAERLVATALAAARVAVDGHGERLATGGADCCACPLCRAIAAVRDPSPEFAERLATGAGDLAAGVASLLRSFSQTAAPYPPGPPGSPPTSGPPGPPPAPDSRPAPDSADRDRRPPDSGGCDRAADAEGREPEDPRPEGDRDVWAAATRAGAAEGIEDPHGAGECPR